MNEHRRLSSPGHGRDYFAWTQHQAALLRDSASRLAKDVPDLDLQHIAEEIEGLGSADLNSVKSFIRQILIHLIKAAADPSSPANAHWQIEVGTFHADMHDRYTPSMRQLIDVDALWQRAISLAELGLRERGQTLSADIQRECPLRLHDFAGEDFGFNEALEKVRAAIRRK